MVSRPHCIGIDLGGTKTLGGRLHPDGTTSAVAKIATPRSSPQAVVDMLEGMISGLLCAEVAAIGISSLSLVDLRTQRLGYGGPIPIEGMPLQSILEEKFGLPVVVENDANAAAWAEYRQGAGRSVGNLITLTIGTGIGSGIILDHQLYRGVNGVAGEVGRLILRYEDGAGADPTFERFEEIAAGPVLDALAEQTAREAPGSDLASEHRTGRRSDASAAIALAEQGEGAARTLVQRIGRRLGAGIAGCVEILNPEMVILGGGLLTTGSILLETVRSFVADNVMPPGNEVRIERAALGPAAGMIGAALMAQERASSQDFSFNAIR